MSNFVNSRFSQFFIPWPTSALEIERQERKRLKKYSRADQQKKRERQVQRMNYLDVPVYDLILDEGAEVQTKNASSYPDKNSFLWPFLPGFHFLKNTANEKLIRKSHFILFPNTQWTSMVEGFYLSSGDEIKANMPLAPDKRYLTFEVFPFTPGNIRVVLGQYVWAHTFNQSEVQKKVKISIPIHDSTATNIRIMNISCNLYLFGTIVSQLQRSAREAIRVSRKSDFWMPNPSYVVSQPTDPQTAESSFEKEDSEKDLQDEKSAEDPKFDDKKTDTETTSTLAKPNFQGPLKQNLSDPFLQVANPQIVVDDKNTSARGYNVVVIFTGDINSEILKNTNLLSKLAPNIFKLMQSSYLFQDNVSLSQNNDDNFRKIIFPQYRSYGAVNSAVIQEDINTNESSNTYQIFRKYGYKVLSISTPETLLLNENISIPSGFPSIYNKWLNQNDWYFERKNIQLEDRSNSISGLEAIFKMDAKKFSSFLTNKDYKIISNYLINTSDNINKFANWGASDYIFVDKKNYYFPKVIDAFQNWTLENQQSRFFSHILLSSYSDKEKSSLNDLKRSFYSSKSMNPLTLRKYARVSYTDRAIGQLIDTIKARRIENRTLVLIVFKDKDEAHSSAFIKIPGLIPKRTTKKHTIDLKQITKILFSITGIPIDKKNDQEIKSNFSNSKNESEEKIDFKPSFLKYTMLIKPNEKICDSFIWKSQAGSVFGLTSNFPIYQVIDTNSIEIFPCSIKQQFISIVWYLKFDDTKSVHIEGNLYDKIGGRFLYHRNSKNFPEFYFGKNLLSSNSLLFNFKKIKANQLSEMFFVNESEINLCLKKTKESFLSLDESFSKNKTKIALFLTDFKP